MVAAALALAALVAGMQPRTLAWERGDAPAAAGECQLCDGTPTFFVNGVPAVAINPIKGSSRRQRRQVHGATAMNLTNRRTLWYAVTARRWPPSPCCCPSLRPVRGQRRGRRNLFHH